MEDNPRNTETPSFLNEAYSVFSHWERRMIQNFIFDDLLW